MSVTLANHFADPVGVFVGGNPGAGGTLPEGMSVWKAAWRALFGKNTVHNCYRNTEEKECAKLWL